MKAERNDNMEFFAVASRDISRGTAPKAKLVRRRKASIARATAKPPDSCKNPQAVPLSIPGADNCGGPCVCHPSS